MSSQQNQSAGPGPDVSWLDRKKQPVKLGDFVYPHFGFKPVPELHGAGATTYPVVVVGGGMVGLTAAIDLAQKGIRCVLIDDNDTVSAGSRSIAQARRTMNIWDRLGCAGPMSDKGISWNKGHTHYGPDCVLSFEVFPEGESRYPSFTSLAQYYVEHYLVEKAQGEVNLDLRWLNRLSDICLNDDGSSVELSIDTPEGSYRMKADWVVAADGARSAVRTALGLPFPGDRLQDKFVIADVRSNIDLPNERNFWFEPPFYDGNTVLRVPQSDSIWRIDWQIDTDVDVDAELAPAKVQERLTGIFGRTTDFKAEWVSTYTSEHRVMDSFRHGRIFFVGDAAHQLSPFGGGRGGNSGVQDADNLIWKLAAVVKGHASERILESYNAERRPIATGNISDSMKSTEFITPKSRHSKSLRDAVMRLANVAPFAKAYVNTGRFAVWPVLETSPLSLPDVDAFAANARPGTPVLDCPLSDHAGARHWLSEHVGNEFVLLIYDRPQASDAAADEKLILRLAAHHPFRIVRIAPQDEPASPGGFTDQVGAFARQYDATPGTVYLLRPDQHVVARWRKLDATSIETALRVALGFEKESIHGAR